jgi:hypothetical protein
MQSYWLLKQLVHSTQNNLFETFGTLFMFKNDFCQNCVVMFKWIETEIYDWHSLA